MLSKLLYISTIVMGAIVVIASALLFFVVALTDPLTSVSDRKALNSGLAMQLPVSSRGADAMLAQSGSRRLVPAASQA